MIVKVKIGDKSYAVEINNLQERPIHAIVDGDEFEIWPESEPAKSIPNIGTSEASIKTHGMIDTAQIHPDFRVNSPQREVKASGPTLPFQTDALKVVRAPIPGVITAVDVHVGAEVTIGQQLCVLEAMKMNNSIRASRAGHIAVVHVTPGQHVKHHDVLVEYTG